MKKTIAMTLALLLMLAVFSGCSQEKQEELNLYTWEGMFPREVLDSFTEETGIKINFASFDTNEAMLAKLESTQGGEYDLILADDYIIEAAIAQGLVLPLDREQIPNFSNINPLFQGQYYDPEDIYTVPLRCRHPGHRIQSGTGGF